MWGLNNMYFEIIALGVIIIFILNYTGRISGNKFVADNSVYFQKLKEDDWDFYVRSKYGENVDPDVLFNKRIRNGIIAFFLVLCFFINSLSYVYIILALLAAFGIFKLDYINIKNFYKRHLHQIDILLPYYLKGLEILIQHYTVPVALAKSINDAPEIFKPGLNQLVSEINAGDSTVEPYMRFARDYPVRDSMRMMRLLYRLSLGRQERKQEQLVSFSKTISNLQLKARETKYKERLEAMEKKTMSMLISTCLGMMVLLILSLLMMMSF